MRKQTKKNRNSPETIKINPPYVRTQTTSHIHQIGRWIHLISSSSVVVTHRRTPPCWTMPPPWVDLTSLPLSLCVPVHYDLSPSFLPTQRNKSDII